MAGKRRDNTIITAYEVVKYSPALKDFPTVHICNVIKAIEMCLFDECWLGYDFYETIRGDKIDFTDVCEYDSSKTYNTGDKVVHMDCVLESTIDNNTTHPNNDNFTNWIAVDKFQTAKYNDLWHDGVLKNWIAYEVLLSILRPATHQISAKGIVRFEGDQAGNEGVDEKAIKEMKLELRTDANRFLNVMYSYIKRANEKAANTYDIKGLQTDDCGNDICKPPSKGGIRRIYFDEDN